MGAEYTKERIKERIVRDYSKKNLIDTTEDKFAESPGLKHWADIQNLKITAASYSRAGSIAELEKQIAAKSALAKTARESLVGTEHQLKNFGQILKYAEQYSANRIYHIRYQKSKDKDRYLRQHETLLVFAVCGHRLRYAFVSLYIFLSLCCFPLIYPAFSPTYITGHIRRKTNSSTAIDFPAYICISIALLPQSPVSLSSSAAI